MEDNDEDQTLPAKATDEDIRKELGDEETKTDDEELEQDTLIYLKSSSIISILVIVIISLVCILATSLVIKSVLQSRGITRTLSAYLGFTPNRTIDESVLTYWQPKSIYDDQPIETVTAIMNSSSTRPPPVILNRTEKKAQTIFRNIILPILFLISIIFGFLAFYMRRHHHYYPAWGARPKKPEQYVTIELKPPKTTKTNNLI